MPGLIRDKKTFALIIISIYIVLMFLSVVIGLSSKANRLMVVGDFQFYSGALLFFLGFLGILGNRRGRRWSIFDKIDFHETKEEFLARRERDRPIEFIALSVSIAGLLLAITGYAFLNLFL